MINTVKKLMTIGCFLVTLISYSQDILWEKSFGGTHADYLFDAQPTADYGFILAGSSLSKKTGNKTDDNKGNLDYWVWKMDEHGELDWQKTFGGSGMDLLQSVRVTQDGGFILAGTSNSGKGDQKKDACLGKDDFWIIKLDANGKEQWQRTLGGSGQELLQSVSQTADGGFILGGSSASQRSKQDASTNKFSGKKEDSFGNMDYWVVKLDSQGVIEWQRTIGGAYADILRSVVQSDDGGYLLGGSSNSPISGNKSEKRYGDSDYWVVKLDKKGETEWEKVYGGDHDDQLYVLLETYDGNFIIGGNSSSSATGNKNKSNRDGTDFWMLKIDINGNVIWQETYHIGNVDLLTSVVENADHTLLLGGYSKSENIDNGKKDAEDINDYVVIKTDEKGDELWRKSVGSEGTDILRKAIETRDGGYILAGTSNPISNTSKTKKSGNLPLEGISNGEQLAGAQQLENSMSAYKAQGLDAANDLYKDQASTVKNGINDALGNKDDSPLKMGLNAPTDILQGGSGGKSFDAADALSGLGQKKEPASRDKKNNYGNHDFWVVKLKDKQKKEKLKVNVEAIPNPAIEFTNIIVGYDFEKGTATVYDLAGRQIQSFAISDRTVPIDLTNLSEGIYIVQVKTNVSTDSVKVIKGITRD